tara:strand:+ start:1419 stop:1925 length:507 start_codon:yes stop_codon:yes gene_type:complete
MPTNAITPLNTVNTPGEKNFTIFGEGWELRDAIIKESTAYAAGQAMRAEISGSTTTGKLVSASTNSGVNSVGANFYGIMAEPVRSTDSDYATAGKTKKVWVPVQNNAECRFTVGAGTFTTADINKTAAIHSDGISVAVDTNGLGCKIVGYISSTRGVCTFDIPATLTA